MAKNFLDRAERKLSVLNTLFIRQGRPRLAPDAPEIDITFSGADILDSMRDAGDKIFKGFCPGTSVLIKISLNSPNPYPASTSREMLESVISCLKDKGVNEICVADSAGMMHLPTRKVMKEKGLSFLKRYDVRLSVFDYGPWINIPVNGIYFKNIILPQSIHNFDRFINLSNLKSHWSAGFTSAAKSLVGLMHPGQRSALHRDHLLERITEISLAVIPDINIIDARKIFVDGGPDEGKKVEADTIFVNNDLMKIDLKAYSLLVKKQAEHRINLLDPDPLNNMFFKHFMRIRDLG
jgi:uncharacterized protein (DUF362 family)